MGKNAFTELAVAQISDKRQAVVSKLSDGSYTIGQKVLIKDGDKELGVFLKGALHAKDTAALENLREAINVVLIKERS